jgi:glycosyltransferase involved in cell wall biosynthesis
LNAAATLGATIESVLSQTRQDWEMLLVDDGSDDDSRTIIEGFATADPRIKLLQTAGRQGAGIARNHGIAAARGRYIAFVDADDMWHPRKLDLQIEAMQAARIPFSCTAYTRKNALTLETRDIGVPPLASRADLLKTNTVACSSAIYDRAFFGEKRMPHFRRRQDFAFWLELLTLTPNVLGIPSVLMTYREHPKSLSGKKLNAAIDTWKMYRSIADLSVPVAAWYFTNYAIRGATRYYLPAVAHSLGWLQTAQKIEDVAP